MSYLEGPEDRKKAVAEFFSPASPSMASERKSLQPLSPADDASDEDSWAELPVDQALLSKEFVSPTQARSIRLARAAMSPTARAMLKNDFAIVDPYEDAKRVANMGSKNSSTSTVISSTTLKVARQAGHDIKARDFASYFSKLDNKSLEVFQNFDTADVLDDIADKLDLTKCVSYLSPDAITWMNKRRPKAINDISHHYSRITPSKALQLLAIFRGLDYDNSGEISKKELQEAFSYVMAATSKPSLFDRAHDPNYVEGIMASKRKGDSDRLDVIRRGSLESVSSQSISLSSSGTTKASKSSRALKSKLGGGMALNAISKNMGSIFDSMDIDGDGMVSFNEFVVQLTSNKSSSGIDNEKVEQAFYEFAMAHQRHMIIDKLNDNENKLSDVEKYYQLRKLFKLELMKKDTTDISNVEDRIQHLKEAALKEQKSVIHRKHHLQRQKEMRRARYALASLRNDKMFRDSHLVEYQDRSPTRGTKGVELRKSTVRLEKLELPAQYLSVLSEQKVPDALEVTKKTSKMISKKLSSLPIPPPRTHEVAIKARKLPGLSRLDALDLVAQARAMSVTFGSKTRLTEVLPPIQ